MVGRTARLDGSGDHRGVHILARSISRELLNQGYELRDVIELAGELLEVACDSLRSHCGHGADGAAPTGALDPTAASPDRKVS